MKVLKLIWYGGMAAISGLLGVALLMVFGVLAGLLALDAIRHPSWPELPGLPTFTTIGRLAVLLAGVAVAVVLWRVLGGLQAWFELRRERREEEKFWETVERRRPRIEARFREWDEAEARAREEEQRQQQEFMEKLAAQGYFKRWHEENAKRREELKSLLTEEERIELGLELSQGEKWMLESLTPFLSGLRPSTPEISESQSNDSD